jgi:hypothetical protein
MNEKPHKREEREERKAPPPPPPPPPAEPDERPEIREAPSPAEGDLEGTPDVPLPDEDD